MIDSAIEIKTFNQLVYHIENNEIIICPLEDGASYFLKEEDYYVTIIQPNYGTGVSYRGGLENIENIFNQAIPELQFFVVKGGTLSSREPNTIDKIFNFFRRIITR